eukprot:683931-Prorocentrum_minimum.AAC.1
MVTSLRLVARPINISPLTPLTSTLEPLISTVEPSTSTVEPLPSTVEPLPSTVVVLPGPYRTAAAAHSIGSHAGYRIPPPLLRLVLWRASLAEIIPPEPRAVLESYNWEVRADSVVEPLTSTVEP